MSTWGFSRPTPRGEVEGLAVGVSRPTPGKGGVSRPTPGGDVSGPTPVCLHSHTWEGGVSQHVLRQTPQQTATAASGTHPTGMHSCKEVIYYVDLCKCHH